ncbi:MAG: SDR family NAD(P)-dependent oxidoreductase [Clostridia bacterium]|nr:SDR family NAD(P)-dependent oxidoreductase [Clostridia bacterium]
MKRIGTAWMIGVSSGLGLATAKAFLKAGWLVIAGSRAFAERDGTLSATAGMLRDFGGSAAHCLSLDVTSGESCQSFVRNALSISGQVDVLCYCAGLLVLGSCEETGVEEYERVMRTNFLGMARMVAHTLPIMRAQGCGRLVLFSSLNGVLGIPFQSAYTASKHAIEGYAQCLAMETKPFGISVCVVEPGDHQGGSQAYRLRVAAAGSSPYGGEYASACQTICRDESNGLSAESLGHKVYRNTVRRKMRYRLRVARLDQRLACWLHALLNPGFFFAVIRGYYVKKG